MSRPATRGPGSNQHADKPPLPPKDLTEEERALTGALDPSSDPLDDEPYYADELDELLDIPSPRDVQPAPAEYDWNTAPQEGLSDCVIDAMIAPNDRLATSRATKAADELLARDGLTGDDEGMATLERLRAKNPATFDRILPGHADVLATSKVDTDLIAAVLAHEEKDQVQAAIAFTGAMSVPFDGDADPRQDVLYDHGLYAARGHVYCRLAGVVDNGTHDPRRLGEMTPEDAEKLVEGIGLREQVYRHHLDQNVSPDIARALAVEARETGKRAMEKAAGRTYRSGYADVINDAIAETGLNHLRPEWVEANMRSQYGTLDAVDRATFTDEVRMTHQLWRTSGSAAQDSHAQSWGLNPSYRGR